MQKISHRIEDAVFVFTGAGQMVLLHKLHMIYHHNQSLSSCRNCMESLPDWLCEAKKLEVLDVSHNLITELPARSVCPTCTKVCKCTVRSYVYFPFPLWQQSSIPHRAS